MEIKVSDDKLPMTGTWYRSTIDPTTLGKVTAKTDATAEVTMSGGRIDHCTFAEFADSWELS